MPIWNRLDMGMLLKSSQIIEAIMQLYVSW